MFKVPEVGNEIKSNNPTKLCKGCGQRNKKVYLEAVSKEKKSYSFLLESLKIPNESTFSKRLKTDRVYSMAERTNKLWLHSPGEGCLSKQGWTSQQLACHLPRMMKTPSGPISNKYSILFWAVIVVPQWDNQSDSQCWNVAVSSCSSGFIKVKVKSVISGILMMNTCDERRNAGDRCIRSPNLRIQELWAMRSTSYQVLFVCYLLLTCLKSTCFNNFVESRVFFIDSTAFPLILSSFKKQSLIYQKLTDLYLKQVKIILLHWQVLVTKIELFFACFNPFTTNKIYITSQLTILQTVPLCSSPLRLRLHF